LKDTGGTDFRRNLITVPSCDLHNLKKCKDDEFLLVSLAGIIGNNSVGYRHRLTKVNRALKRSAGRLLEAVYRRREHFVIEAGANRFIEVIWGTPDHDRLVRCFTSIAYGLYFRQFGQRFRGAVKLHMAFLRYSDANSASFSAFIKYKVATDLDGAPRAGENPDAFYYQFEGPDEFGLHLVKMCFYGGVEVYAAFVPEGTALPTNLALELIKRGLPTYVRVGDKVFGFNDSLEAPL
jgi:hypothetical protein